MGVAVVTRTQVAPRYVAPFVWASLRAARQAAASPGYVAGALRISRGPVYWTLTLWADGRAMQGFRDSGVHLELMPSLAKWATDGVFAGWRTPDNRLPDWAEVDRRVQSEGRSGPLDHPSAAHLAGVVAATQLPAAILAIPPWSAPPRIELARSASPEESLSS